MSKQEQENAWLAMSKEELDAECVKYGLKPDDKMIKTVQKLFNYLEKEEQNIFKAQNDNIQPAKEMPMFLRKKDDARKAKKLAKQDSDDVENAQESA